MNSPKPSPASLFQVYLRLRPPMSQQAEDQAERCLTIEAPEPKPALDDGLEAPAALPTHITLQPPSDSRKRAIERFGFTKVFEESASQLDIYQGTELESLVRGVLMEGRDGLIATLGVTGSGKSHTILGSKTQRGITQMSLDVIFRSLASTIRPPDNSINPLLLSTVAASDASESQMFTAQTFLEAVYGDPADRGRNSRAQTPMSTGRAHTPLTVWRLPRTPLQGTLPSMIPRSRPSTTHTGPYLRPYNGPPPISCYINPLVFHPKLRDKMKDGGIATPITPSNIKPGPGQVPRANMSYPILKEPMPALIFPRRNMPPRSAAAPRSPDVSHLTVDLNPHSEYVVLVSMYEVYNDRIFDLLSPAIAPGQGSAMSRQGGTSLKDRRRPLFFKSTEGSPDRKVVAGLRKIACNTYEEALSVLEVGLTERKVTGTGANSVSSRSHGFFCIEVKRRMRNKRTGEETWMGHTLTVADLAGSERARTAKTAGSTLAEAGKINESLMYLGQCLQMQSDIQDGNKAAMVPFRQCKLTELLFSNSFPSSTSGLNRHPQKAIMIVTADPAGDYNATSQILRYSALAREVAVPRAPSIAESIMSSTLGSRHGSASGRNTPSLGANEELEKALAEIARLTMENESLSVRLAEEEIMRSDLEIRLRASEERSLMIEQDVREECWNEMDERMEEERKKWQTAWDEQAGYNNEHLDKKIELVSRGFQIHEDPTPSNEQIEDLEFENDQLRSKVASLERELNCRSPTKKSKSKTTLESSRNSNILGRESDIENALKRMDQLKLADTMFSPAPPTTTTTTSSAPGKRQRKMATRKWDLAPEENI
ncbi:P-loop containing nucleoside triphosphate hydrolase protein [Aspergillus heteromorphus CBS 117.55]|uniref:P-loop containing nucleoside triphosphate hydrolase protein n=1 Tax=Aspergillus heteromorphus CBS 117.55 TaxID=1448321 RepID=A0A317X3G6_9EURO|nr:P-loop containing nucleoside triphosphate hydrolase protein [Aspergillus heteromorphus CBS 117.55]PWY92047.1 P-loop containing nucleoside triphosphate hydrolase protein [Aspergillus heteromorphus CBS 117.55]